MTMVLIPIDGVNEDVLLCCIVFDVLPKSSPYFWRIEVRLPVFRTPDEMNVDFDIRTY